MSDFFHLNLQGTNNVENIQDELDGLLFGEEEAKAVEKEPEFSPSVPDMRTEESQKVSSNPQGVQITEV